MYYKIEYIERKINSNQNSLGITIHNRHTNNVKTILIKANTENEALEQFKKKRLGILKSIERIEYNTFLEKLALSFESKKVNFEELLFIFNQLYVMFDAGLSVDLALENVIESIKDRKLRRIFSNILQEIEAGSSLTNAFKKYEEYLGVLTVSMIQLGEQTGDLANALKELSIILEDIWENRRRLKKATRYPIFIIFAMIVAFVIVILLVLPPFKSIFQQLGTELPLPTRILLWIEHAVRTYGIYILSGAILFSITIGYLYKTSPKARLFLDKLLLHIYIVGDVIYYAMIGRFVYVFEKLIEAGVGITDSLDIALNIVDNDYLRKQLLKIKTEIIRGGTIAKGMEETKLFEKMIIQIIKSGEGSGALVRMLNKARKYYFEKYRDLVDNISALIEPILIAAIAGFILTLALGIFLPMWNLTQITNG